MRHLATVLPLAATILSLGGCRESAPVQAAGPAALVVRTATVERREIAPTLQLTGSLRPRSRVTVVAEVPGRLLQASKDEGDAVREGDVLAILDDTDVRLADERAQAARRVAEANRDHAATERERAKQLLGTGGITDRDRLAADVQLQVAEAALSQARTESAIAATQRERSRIRSPLTGHVARRLADPGAMLAQGAAVFELVDDAVLELRAAVPSSDYGKVLPGAAVTVAAESNGRLTREGRVARISPVVDEKSRSFEIVVQVERGEGLAAGMFASATLHLPAIPGALLVPPQALARDPGDASRARVFVVEGGTARRRDVVVGLELPSAVEVKEGLSAGATVILDPPMTLSDGATVSPQPDPAR